MRIQNINNYPQYKQYNVNRNKYNDNSQKTGNIDNVAFKAKFWDKVGKFFGEKYAEPMYNKEWVHKTSEKLSKFPGQMTQHMSVLGSLLTSSVYMEQTLTKKDLDKKRRKTLAINQGLGFIVPTALGYWVDTKLREKNKKLEYRYAGIQEQKKALGQISAEKAAELEAKLGRRLKGFKTLATLLTFSLIYRFFTPVAITPLANWLGRKFFGEDEAPKEKAVETTLKPDNTAAAKEIVLEPNVGKAKEIELNPEYKQSA